MLISPQNLHLKSFQCFSVKPVLTTKLFFPLKESDEDFANHSDNDQNRVRLMYWSDFILNINWSIVYILNIYQNCFWVNYEKLRVCSFLQLICLQAFHIFRLTSPWYNFSQFCFYFIFIFLRKQVKKKLGNRTSKKRPSYPNRTFHMNPSPLF